MMGVDEQQGVPAYLRHFLISNPTIMMFVILILSKI